MFYAFISRARKTRNKIGPLVDDDGNVITDSTEQATLLNDYYATVFTINETATPEVETSGDGAELDDLEIGKETTKHIIDNLKVQSASGPDGIPPRVLKELRDEIAEPLTILFRKSIDLGEIPDEWREAEVTPIFKKGKPDQCYRKNAGENGEGGTYKIY